MNEKAVSMIEPPEGYGKWLEELKARIHAARQRATLAVNRELILLYWQIGRDILARQAEQGWGAKVIDRLSGNEGVFAAQPQVYAHLCGGMG